MSAHWDKVNKWLYLGTKQGQNNQFTIMFDNWIWFFKYPTIRQWSLFQIMWDNGAWWADINETEETKDISIPHMNGKYIEQEYFTVKTGTLPCFLQITILGIGFRYWYEKKTSIVLPKINQKENYQ